MELKQLNRLWGPAKWKTTHLVTPIGTYFNEQNIQIIFELTPKCQDTKLAHMSTLLESGFMADVQFVVKGEKIAAHLPIVASVSPAMAAMFGAEHCNASVKWFEGKYIPINDTEPEVFREMLRYLYAGKRPKPELVEPLMVAAEKYQIYSLKQECEDLMIFTLTADNVIERLMLAYEHSAFSLLQTCLDHVIQLQDEIVQRPEWKQLCRKHPDVFFLATRRMLLTNRRRRVRIESPSQM